MIDSKNSLPKVIPAAQVPEESYRPHDALVLSPLQLEKLIHAKKIEIVYDLTTLPGQVDALTASVNDLNLMEETCLELGILLRPVLSIC